MVNIKRGWWKLTTTMKLEDSDREHIAELVKQGYVEGEVIQEKEDNG